MKKAKSKKSKRERLQPLTAHGVPFEDFVRAILAVPISEIRQAERRARIGRPR